MRVFLSYRREDAGGHAGRLADALVQRLGARGVFHDVIAIAPGQDFMQVIDDGLDDCDAALAVIGPHWVTASTARGTSRLSEADDVVRMELARALERDVRVVPVLVGGARLPAATELPEALRPLVQRQAVTLHDETWHDDVNGLVRSLRGEPVAPASPTRRRRLLLGGGVVVLAVLAAGTVWWTGTRDADDDDTEVAACPSPDGAAWHALTTGDDPTGGLEIDEGPLEFGVRAAYWRELEPGTWQMIVETSMENQTPGELEHGEWYYDALGVGRRAFTTAPCFSPEEGQESVPPDTVGDARVGFEVLCPPEGNIALRLSTDHGTEVIDVTSETLEPSAC